jgi:hypothetical protein
VNRDQHEATLNLLGWQPVRMQICNQLIVGVTRGLQFIYAYGLIDIEPGQTAIAEDFAILSNWHMRVIADKAMHLEKQGEP